MRGNVFRTIRKVCHIMKRNIWTKRISAAALAATLAMSGAAITVAAAGATPDGMIDEVYDFKYIHADYVDDSEYTTTQKDSVLLKKVVAAIRNYEESLNVESYGISRTECNALMIIAKSAYPELFFFDIDNSSIDYYRSSQKAVTVHFHYTNYKTVNGKSVPDKDKMNSQLKAFYSEADRYLNMVKGKLSAYKDEYSKALLLHDEMVLDVTYNDSHRDNYRFMINKNGLCANYSEIYSYLLGQLGIKSELIVTPDSSKNGMQHEWMKVRLDGKYYNVDATWDDPSPERKGMVYHTFFLLSDQRINKMDQSWYNHYGYKYLNGAYDTRYDYSKYHNYTSKICKLDPDATVVYAVNNETNGKKIVSYDYVTDQETKLVDLSGKNWNIKSDSVYKGMTQTGLDHYDGYLFYNDAQNIYRLDVKTKKSTIVKKADSGKQFFGVRIRNNVLYAQNGTTDPALTTSLNLGSIVNYLPKAEPIKLNQAAVTLGKGETLTLKATVDASLSNKTVAWSTTNSSVATVSGGTVTAKGVGTATIKAKDSNGNSAQCTVTVKAPAASVSLNATSKTMKIGETFKFISSVTDGASYKRTFTTSDSSVLKITETTVGTCTVRALKNGVATLTVKTFNGKSASCKVTVSTGPSSVSLNKTAVTLGINETCQLIGTVYGGTSDLSFSTSDKTIVKIASTTSNTCTIRGLKAGTAKLTAKTSNGKTATCTVTVKKYATYIKFPMTTVTFGVGETFKFISSADGYTGTRTFTSSNSSVLKITATTTGTCTVRALKEGTAVLRVRTATGKTAACTVTVKAAAAGITLSPASATLSVGDTQKLISSVKTGASYQRTFTSSDSSVLKITATTVGTCTVKALKAGTATITVKTFNGKTASCKVTVKADTQTAAQKRFSNLEKFILNHYDSVSGDVYKMIRTENDDGDTIRTSMIYQKSKREIRLNNYVYFPDNDLSYVIELTYNYSNPNKCAARVTRTDDASTNTTPTFVAKSTLNPATYQEDSTLNYTLTYSDADLKDYEDVMTGLSDTCIKINIHYSQKLLDTKGGTVSDLGFIKFTYS